MHRVKNEEERAFPRLYTIKRKNIIAVNGFAARNFVSVSKLFNFFIEKVLQGNYGEDIIDDAVRFALPKKYKL